MKTLKTETVDPSGPNVPPTSSEYHISSPGNAERGAMILMFLLLLSRILAVVRDSVMVAKFPIGNNTDAYRLAFSVPDLIQYGVAGGAFSSAFIPIYTEFISSKNEDDAAELFNVIMTSVGLFVLALIAIFYKYSPNIINFFAHNDKPAQVVQDAILMGRILLPAQFAFFVGGIVFGVLYARGNVRIPGLGPLLYNIGIIFGALFLSSFVHPAIASLPVGAVAGAVFGSLLLPLFVIRKYGVKYRPSLNMRAPGVKRVFILMAPAIFGLSLPAVFPLIMQRFASEYGTGINTVVELANRIMQAPLGIFGQSLAIAAFPVMSAHAALKRHDLFSRQAERTMGTVLYLTIPVAVFLYALAPDAVHLLYAYGKSAKAASLVDIQDALRFFAIGIPAWCLQPILFRAYFSIQKSVKPVVLGTIATVLFVVFIYLFQSISNSFLVMPIACTVAAYLLVFALLIALKLDVPELHYGKLTSTSVKASIASLSVGVVAYFLGLLIPLNSTKFVLLLGFTLLTILFGWLYYFFTNLLKMEECRVVNAGMARFQTKLFNTKGEDKVPFPNNDTKV